MRKSETVNGRVQISKFDTRRKGDIQHQDIRFYARKAYLELVNKNPVCERCGYSKMSPDIAHVKPISEYSDDTTVIEMNELANMIALCKNCHWEFDRGMVPVEEIKTIIAARVVL